jgi:DNA polymerase-3 subunit delta
VVAVKTGDVAGALRRIPPGITVVLVYGPDAGLVGERARAAAEATVSDPNDPFQLVRIEGDAVAADPGRLADEAGTIGLFGGRRAIWVKPTSRNLAPAVEAVLAGSGQDAMVVIEAGDLARTAPVRTVCERSPKALALPCYADNARDLAAVVDETLRDASLRISPEARATLIASLGGDRLASRGELAKLVLYAHGQGAVTLDDVDAVVSDVSSLAMDAVVDAAFAGDLEQLDAGYRRLTREGVAAAAVLAGALRHALVLLAQRVEIEETGRSITSAVEGWRGLHFRRRNAIERQLRAWTGDTLRRRLGRLQAELLDSRRVAALGDAIAARALVEIGREAARSSRR